MKKVRHILYFLLLAGTTQLLFISCAVNPVTGKKEFMLMSEQQEIALGASSDPSILAQFGLYEDETLQAFINEKGQEMAKISHRPHLEYEFKIVDSPILNAFAVPGGYVYFTRGIMAHFNNEAEFAGVLGHEIGHITARHSARQYSRGMLAQIGLVGGMVLSEDFRNYANLANTGLQLLFLKFGRDAESQSDRLGVEYSTKIGYDSHHMANFFNTLSRMREQSGGEAIPTFMSTHPDPGDRYANVSAMSDQIQSEMGVSDLTTGRDSYLRMLEGLVYGEDPRHGYVENSVFYHPEMKFQFPAPNQWKIVNTASQVQMASPDEKAMMLLQLAKGNSLEDAANTFITENQLNQLSIQKTTVNGFSAVVVLSEQVPQETQQVAQTSNSYQQQNMTEKTRKDTQPSSSGTSSGNTGSSTSSSSNTRKLPDSDIPTRRTGGSTTSSPNTPTKLPDSGTNSSPTPSSPSSRNTGGNNAVPGSQNPETLKILTYFIDNGGTYLAIHGLAKTPDFSPNQQNFTYTMTNFKKLTDPAKINVKPERIRIREAKSAGSLSSVLKSYNVPADKMEEHALLNGLQLDNFVNKGTLVKIITK
ncbi:MAG: M48 family metalloprotease [Bacteroidota bacterium]